MSAWTVEERARLRAALQAAAPRIDWHSVARFVRTRTASACWQYARTLKLFAPRKHVRHDATFREEVRRLNLAGLNDVQIASRLGTHRGVIGRWRRALRLAPNRMNADQRVRCGRTWFKRGQLNGRAAKLLAGSGQTRVRKRHKRGGYMQRFVKVGGRWVPFARIVWEGRHGPLPPDRILVHVNGKTLDDRLENLRAITRRELPAWQASVRPKMEDRRRRGAARTARERWQIYRGIKALREGTA